MKNFRTLVAALVAAFSLAALAGCQVVSNPGDEEGGFACLFDADRDGVGAFIGADPTCSTYVDVRDLESLDEAECRAKARQGWEVDWLSTSPIDFNDEGDCDNDDPTPADDDDATDDNTPADDDDATEDDTNVLSLSWESMGDAFGRLLLVGNPPNLPAQVFANVVDRDHVNVDIYLNNQDFDQFEWIVLGFTAEESYEDWQSCRAENPINECWMQVDFESCTGDFETGEAFLVGRHSASWEGDSRPVHASGNPYDGCIAVVGD